MAENNPKASSPHTDQFTLMWPTEKAAAAPAPQKLREKKIDMNNMVAYGIHIYVQYVYMSIYVYPIL